MNKYTNGQVVLHTQPVPHRDKSNREGIILCCFSGGTGNMDQQMTLRKKQHPHSHVKKRQKQGNMRTDGNTRPAPFVQL